MHTFRTSAPSALLSKVAAFLPALAEANAKLDAQIAAGAPTESFRVELEQRSSEDDDSDDDDTDTAAAASSSSGSSGGRSKKPFQPYIEMDIDVGILEMKKEGELDDDSNNSGELKELIIPSPGSTRSSAATAAPIFSPNSTRSSAASTSSSRVSLPSPSTGSKRQQPLIVPVEYQEHLPQVMIRSTFPVTVALFIN